MAVRSYNGRELLTGLNHNFEKSPNGVATTVNNRWVDGTSGGAATNAGGYNWRSDLTGNAAALFDGVEKHSGSYSAKVSTLGVASYCTISTGNLSDGVYIPVIPKRTYTISGWMKTRYVSGDSLHGAALSMLEMDVNGLALATNNWSNYVKTTTDWTYYTQTFTAGAKTRYIKFDHRVYGHTGAATLIMDAWFDDISLTEVLPARNLAVSRDIAINRVVTRDMGTALDTFVSSGFVNIGTAVNAAINSANAYTFAQWIKRGPVQGTLQSFMGAPSADKAWFNFLPDNSVRLYNSDLTPPAINTLAAQRTIADQKWHLMVGTFDGTTRKIYIDGLAQTTSTATSTGALNLTATFYVTAFQGGNNFRGKSDEARIWNRALTATEVQNMYFNNIVPRDNLVAEYLFNEGSGATALDTSGNGNNGTITGATYTTDVPLQPRDLV